MLPIALVLILLLTAFALISASKTFSGLGGEPKMSWADYDDDEEFEEEEVAQPQPEPEPEPAPQRTEQSIREEFWQRIPDESPFTAFVGNVPYSSTEDDIGYYFETAGATNVRLNRKEGRTTAAYVDFATKEDLITVLMTPDLIMKGRPIRVDVATRRGGGGGDRGDRGDRRGGYGGREERGHGGREERGYGGREERGGYGRNDRGHGPREERGGYGAREGGAPYAGREREERGPYRGGDRRGGDRRQGGGAPEWGQNRDVEPRTRGPPARQEYKRPEPQESNQRRPLQLQPRHDAPAAAPASAAAPSAAAKPRAADIFGGAKPREEVLASRTEEPPRPAPAQKERSERSERGRGGKSKHQGPHRSERPDRPDRPERTERTERPQENVDVPRAGVRRGGKAGQRGGAASRGAPSRGGKHAHSGAAAPRSEAAPAAAAPSSSTNSPALATKRLGDAKVPLKSTNTFSLLGEDDHEDNDE